MGEVGNGMHACVITYISCGTVMKKVAVTQS